MLKTIVTAGIALILATTTQGFAQDASPPPASADVQKMCRTQAVDDEGQHDRDLAKKYGRTLDITPEQQRASLQHFLDDGEFFMLARLAKCLAKNKQFDEAVAIMKPIVGYYREDGSGYAVTNAKAVNYHPYEAWHDYALVLDAKGDHPGAGHAMTIAYNLSKEEYGDKLLYADYKRIAAENIATAEMQQRKADAADLAKRVARSRRFWDACSADQRRILVMKGGKDTDCDHNVGENWGPSHIERYDAQGYHVETWWYYGLQGQGSAEAFTFRNGRLISHYQA